MAFTRIDEQVRLLAACEEAAAAIPIENVLAVVADTPGHRVRDHAYKSLRETRQLNRREGVHRLIERAWDELEALARPVDTIVAPAAPPRDPSEPPASAIPPEPSAATATPTRREPPAPLTISTMQAGARYRVVRDFLDFDGTPFRAGTVLTFVGYSYFPYDGGYTIHFLEAGMRLAEIAPENVPVLDNSGNSYFVPADPG